MLNLTPLETQCHGKWLKLSLMKTFDLINTDNTRSKLIITEKFETVYDKMSKQTKCWKWWILKKLTKIRIKQQRKCKNWSSRKMLKQVIIENVLTVQGKWWRDGNMYIENVESDIMDEVRTMHNRNVKLMSNTENAETNQYEN